jgi:hypothetical protein
MLRKEGARSLPVLLGSVMWQLEHQVRARALPRVGSPAAWAVPMNAQMAAINTMVTLRDGSGIIASPNEALKFMSDLSRELPPPKWLEEIDAEDRGKAGAGADREVADMQGPETEQRPRWWPEHCESNQAPRRRQ